MVNREIPIILFDTAKGEWAPFDKGSPLSKAAAMYKNQLVEAERRRLYDEGGGGDLYAARSERRYAEMAEKNKKGRKRIPRELYVFLMIALFFYVLWFFLQP